MKKIDYMKLFLYIEDRELVPYGAGFNVLLIIFGLALLYVSYSTLPRLFPIICTIVISIILLLAVPSRKRYFAYKKEYLEERMDQYQDMINQYETRQKDGIVLKEKDYYMANRQRYHTELINLEKFLEQKQEEKIQKKLKRDHSREQRYCNKF